MRFLFGKTGKGKWVFGQPKADDLDLENTVTEFTLTDELVKYATHNPDMEVKLMLNNEVLKKMVDLGKYTIPQARQLQRLRDVLESPEKFYLESQEILKDDTFPLPVGTMVSLFWYQKWILWLIGVNKHLKYFQKMEKKN